MKEYQIKKLNKTKWKNIKKTKIKKRINCTNGKEQISEQGKSKYLEYIDTFYKI